jgi:hypothetical protein
VKKGRPRSGTHRQIIAWVQDNYGFKPYDAWITHCKEIAGLPVMSRGPRSKERQCPPERRYAILQAFRHFGLIS